MANVNASGTVWNDANFVGTLFRIGADDTAFLRTIGGLNGGRQVNSWEFALASTWSLEAASQPAITEAASVTAPDPYTFVRSQDTNTCQIFQRTAAVTYAKLSNGGTVSGIAVMGETQPVMDEMSFQLAGTLLQVSRDMDHTFLNGVYAQATASNVAPKTRGIFNASSGGTNTVAAGTVALSSSLINELLREMVANGAKLVNPVVWLNAFQKQQISSIYGYAPTDRNVGGVNIKTIETDFCTLGVAFDPHVETDRILIADMSVIKPVFLPVPDKGIVVVEPLSKKGAVEEMQVYTQAGLDYGPEEYHGTITGLTTS
jgi:hypothetical protein